MEFFSPHPRLAAHLQSTQKIFETIASLEALTLTQELIREVSRGNRSNTHNIRDQLQRGADVNGRTDDWQEQTPLLILAKGGGESVRIIVELLKHENLGLNAKDGFCKTALIRASEYGHEEVVRILLEGQQGAY